MDVQQAAVKWEVTEKTAKRLCRRMQVDPENIPEDLRPVYTGDQYGDDPHRIYLELLDVIMNTHLDLAETDPVVMKTCLEQLRKENLIVAKNGRDPESEDYHDYILTPDKDKYYAWHESKTKGSLSLLKRILQLLRCLI
ncbi:MAG: hypothetical protein J5967_06860 [Oscillospiraceae bacterium]|nr:hypothetical protein [Oscillospiraceae bacterium]